MLIKYQNKSDNLYNINYKDDDTIKDFKSNPGILSLVN